MKTVTYHSIDRIMERANLKNEQAAKRNINLALERGKRAEDFSSWEKSYLNNAGHGNCIAVAYNNFCYIISDSGCCIMTYQLPKWFGKKKHFNVKERIRNYKKYYRNNDFLFDEYLYS